MALTSRVKAKLFDAIHVALDKIGVSNSTAVPASKNNREAIAWELMVADELRSRADKRRDAAFDKAIEAGIIPSELANPQEAISQFECWRGEHVAVIGSAVGVKPRLNADMFIQRLMDAGVKPAVVNRAYEQSCVLQKPQRRVKAMPIVVD